MNYASLEGPAERIDGKLVLAISLAPRDDKLVDCARSISEIRGDDLVITIPDWLAEKLGIDDGTLVVVDNKDGKFNLRRADYVED